MIRRYAYYSPDPNARRPLGQASDMSSSRDAIRRRRTGSTARRYKPSELVPIPAQQANAIGKTEIAAAIGVSLAAALLIALIWIVTMRSTNEQLSDIRDRAERMVAAQAATLAEEVRHELLMTDQSLAILQAAWNRDQANFNLADWHKQMPALTAVANDIFIADEKQVVRQDILPQAVGQGVGGPYVTFPHGSLEVFSSDGTKPQEGRLVVGDTGKPIEARRYLMYIVRPLEKPTKWLIGASYRSEELGRLYAQTSLGINGVTALIDSQRGVLQAIVGPSARRPQVDLTKSEMLAFFKNKGDGGIWTGRTAMDDVQRIHGFSKIQGREMYVLVGITETEAMAPAASLASGARSVAFAASAVILMIGGLVLWELFTLRAARRRRRSQARGQADLTAMQSELATVRSRATLTGGQVAAMLKSAADGVALLDNDLRLIAWNQRFTAGCGAAETLREGLPIDELLRRQGRHGLFGPNQKTDPESIETEVARRVAILRTEPSGAFLPQIGPDGSEIGLHAEVVPDGGGVVLMLGGLRAWKPEEHQLPTYRPESTEAPQPAYALDYPVPAVISIEW